MFSPQTNTTTGFHTSALVEVVLIRDICDINACLENGWTPRSTWHMAEKKWYRGHDISKHSVERRRKSRVIMSEHEKAAFMPRFHKYTMMLKVRRICSFTGTKQLRAGERQQLCFQEKPIAIPGNCAWSVEMQKPAKAALQRCSPNAS